MIDLEDRIRRAMSAVADSTVIHASPVPVSRPRRATGPLVGAYAFLATLAVFTVGMLVTGGERATVVPRPDNATAATASSSAPSTASTASPSASEAPLISVDIATLGFEVVQSNPWEDWTPIAGSGERWLQAFRSDFLDFTGPAFWVDTDFDGTDWFRGGFPAEGEPVRFGEHDGHMSADPMMFAFEDREWDVMVVAVGATNAQLQSFVAGLVREHNRWEATDLPPSVVLVSEGPGDPEFPEGRVAAEYATTDGSVYAASGSGDQQVLERHLFSAVLAGAQPATARIAERDVTLAERPGFSADRPAFSSAMWFEFDGQLVVVHVDGSIDIHDVVPLVSVAEIPPGE
jgi:hypothetical protein